MNSVWKFLILLLYLMIIIAGLIIKKIWDSSNSYFNEKAKNYATKQDIEEITRKTESVQIEFKQKLEEFEADLSFKYNFYEKQYTLLYSNLYRMISYSNSIIYFGLNIEKDNEYKNVPIAEFNLDNEEEYENRAAIICSDSNESNEHTSITNILELVENNVMYASPQLIDICMALCYLRKRDDLSNNDMYNESVIKLRKKLVEVIVKDYNWLRNQLRLSDNNSFTLKDLLNE